MYSLRTNGDSIAQEFNRLLGNNQALKKVAFDNINTVEDQAHVEGHSSEGGQPPEEGQVSDDLSDEALTDLLVEPASDYMADSEHMVADVIDDISDGLEGVQASVAADPSGHYIMNGLGKIAGSLRSKGEAFAADVVEATALSIRGDLVKESNRKSNIVETLNKMASDFVNTGDSFAADMVKVTINKIS